MLKGDKTIGQTNPRLKINNLEETLADQRQYDANVKR